MSPAKKERLRDICETAMSAGRRVDLSGCVYGKTDGCCGFVARPTNYYYFLAGLVKTQRLTYVLECGTHYGGSIMAISKGIDRDTATGSRLVTIDVVMKNDEGFTAYPGVKRICGDSANDIVAEAAAKEFDRPIDMLYIDSLHEYEHTKRNIEIYTERLNPEYIVMDDIRLSVEMRRIWARIEEKYGDNAFDVSEIVMRRSAGFGVIKHRGRQMKWQGR